MNIVRKNVTLPRYLEFTKENIEHVENTASEIWTVDADVINQY